MLTSTNSPFQIYNYKLQQHIYLSEFLETEFRTQFRLKNVICVVRSKQVLIESIHFYLIFGFMPKKKQFFLSKAQQRYRTYNIKSHILVVKLTAQQGNNLLHYLILNIFDYNKQSNVLDNIVCTRKDIKFFIDYYPMLYQNSSLLFQQIFTEQISEFSILLTLAFNQYNIKKQLYYTKFYRLIKR